MYNSIFRTPLSLLILGFVIIVLAGFSSASVAHAHNTPAPIEINLGADDTSPHHSESCCPGVSCLQMVHINGTSHDAHRMQAQQHIRPAHYASRHIYAFGVDIPPPRALSLSF